MLILYESVTRFDSENKEKLERFVNAEIKKKWPQFNEYMGGESFL